MNTIRKVPATTQDVEAAIEKAVDKLAVMINEGFKGTPTKDDINRVEVRLDSVEIRLGKIENLLMEEQKRKIEDLETRMKRLEDALAV
jgi:hypothetical protein